MKKKTAQQTNSPEQLGQFFFEAIQADNFSTFKDLFATKKDFLFFLEKSNLTKEEKEVHRQEAEVFVKKEKEIREYYNDILQEAAACKIDWKEAKIVAVTYEGKTMVGVAQLKITVDWTHKGEPYQFVLRQCIESDSKWVITQSASFFDPNWREKLIASVQVEKGFKGEHWRAALKRYEAFITEIERDSKLFFKNKDNLETIKMLESYMGIAFPESLKNVYLKEGAFAIGEELEVNTLFLYSAEKLLYFLKEDFKNLSISQLGFAELIDFTIGHPELKELLSPKEYDFLNDNYKIFGVYYHNESDFRFYYFDKNGQFGTAEYNHDWYHFNRNDWNNEFIPLTKKSKASFTFDELISKEIDQTIDASLEDWVNNGE